MTTAAAPLTWAALTRELAAIEAADAVANSGTAFLTTTQLHTVRENRYAFRILDASIKQEPKYKKPSELEDKAFLRVSFIEPTTGAIYDPFTDAEGDDVPVYIISRSSKTMLRMARMVMNLKTAAGGVLPTMPLSTLGLIKYDGFEHAALAIVAYDESPAAAA